MAAGRDPRTLSGHKRLVPRSGRPGARPAPLEDPRLRPAPARPDPRLGAAGRRAALVLAGVGLAWIAGTALGDVYGWPTRVRALVDLFALAGFGFALYLTWQVWRLSRTHKG